MTVPNNKLCLNTSLSVKLQSRTTRFYPRMSSSGETPLKLTVSSTKLKTVVTTVVFLNTCVHYFSIKSCVQQNHYSQIHRAQKITGVYSEWYKWPVEPSHGVISGQLPVLSDVEKFVLKNFY